MHVDTRKWHLVVPPSLPAPLDWNKYLKSICISSGLQVRHFCVSLTSFEETELCFSFSANVEIQVG